MFKTQHETVLIIALAVSVFFGALAGGLTSFFLFSSDVLESDSDMPEVAIEGISEETEEALRDLIADQEATIAVVEQVTPAVVSIYTEKEFAKSDFLGSVEVTYEFERVGGGTGFFVTADGLIVTNRHVVSQTDARYIVVTSDGQEYEAGVLARDVLLDLAFLRVQGSGFKTILLGDSDAVRIGETVLAVGNTLSAYENSVTKGIISGVDRTIAAGDGFGQQEVIEKAIQTDAPISEGNSGGPLINLYGEVIGVNTAVSTIGESLGFAIPINAVKPLLDDVIVYGRIIRPWLGVRYVMIDDDIREEFELTAEVGALIVPEEATQGASIISGSPAALAGLQAGDVILSVGTIALGEDKNLAEAINSYEPGDLVTLTVLRDGQTIYLDVTLAELDPTKF